MNPDWPVPQPDRVAGFFQKHRTGLVTLVFTDLVDSTALLHQLGDQAGATFLRRRRQILREVLHALPEAEEIETAGDSFLLVFAKPSDSVRFALQSQARLRAFSQESGLKVQERMGIHLGEVVISEHETEVKAKDLYGIQLATCARVMSLAQGGQILLTRGVFDSARQVLKGEDIPGVGGLRWVSHGPYLLKGIEEPVEVCETAESGQSELVAPKTSEKAERQVRADEEPVLGWRPAVGQEVPSTHWVLEKKLGEGGFGEVWLGRHQTMKERRVFKFCFRADRVRSLKREMTLFRLIKERIGDHPNIVALREVYFEQPPYYLEEDYVAGEALASWCQSQGGAEKVPLAVKLEIVTQIAEALQAAHDAGVIHRDVKPANILVAGSAGFQPAVSPTSSRPGAGEGAAATDSKSASHQTESLRYVAKLTDFGIGQVVSQEYLTGVTKAGFTQTMLGSASSQTGTQMYMAPELLAGKPASIRSDIYSLGVVLYQLVVGDLARPLTTDWAREIPDPLLREDLQHCIAGMPEERFAGAAQLARQLRALPQRRAELVRQEAEAEQREQYRRQAEQRRSILVLATGIVGVLFLLAVALGFGLRKADQQRRAAETARDLQRRYAYTADMKAAHVALQENNRGTAVTLLRAQVPKAGETDLRGLEWRYLWQQTRGDEIGSFPLESTVGCAVFSPDGNQVAARAGNGQTVVWELASGKRLREFTDPIGEWMWWKSVAYSPDGKWLALLGQNGVVIRDTTDWRVVQEVKGAESPFRFSNDGKCFVAAGNNRVSLWEAGSWRERVVLTNLPQVWNCLALGPGGSQVAAGQWLSTKLRWCDLGSGTRTVVEVPNDLTAVEVSPDGRWLASGDLKGGLTLWEVAGLHLVQNFRAAEGFLMGLAFSPDSKLLATGGNDQTIRIWQTGTTNLVAALKGHSHEIWSLQFWRDGQKLLSGSQDGTAKLWSLTPAIARNQLLLLPTNADIIGPVEDGRTLVTEDKQARVTQVWSLPDGRLCGSYGWEEMERLSSSNHRGWGSGVEVGVGTNGNVYFWSLVTGKLINSVPLGEGSFWPEYICPKGRWLVGRYPDKKAVLFDLQARRRVSFSDDTSLSWPLAISPDGRWLACGTVVGAIRLWDLGSGREKNSLKGHYRRVADLCFSPDSKLLASGAVDSYAGLWSVEDGRLLHGLLRGHHSGVQRVGFSSDGRTLLTGSDDFTIEWWSVATGREMLRSQDGYSGGWRGRFWVSGETSLIWEGGPGKIWVTTLPTLAEIDAAATASAAGSGR